FSPHEKTTILCSNVFVKPQCCLPTTNRIPPRNENNFISLLEISNHHFNDEWTWCVSANFLPFIKPTFPVICCHRPINVYNNGLWERRVGNVFLFSFIFKPFLVLLVNYRMTNSVGTQRITLPCFFKTNWKFHNFYIIPEGFQFRNQLLAIFLI